MLKFEWEIASRFFDIMDEDQQEEFVDDYLENHPDMDREDVIIELENSHSMGYDPSQEN